MPEIQRPSGLRIAVPENYELVEPPAAVKPGRGARRARLQGPIPMPSQATQAGGSAVLAAFTDREMQLVEQVELRPQVEPSGQRRAPAAASQSAEFSLDVTSGEDAVLLLEQDGVFSWNLPQASEPLPAAAPVRRGAAPPAPGRRVRFQVEIRAGGTPTPAGARRGLVSELVWDRVTVYALKFAAKIAVGQAIKFLERNVSKGLVRMDGLDPAGWRLAAPASLRLPADKPARILLFVHGTFSSTAGSYGALGATPWGQAFLTAAASNYDVVLGFDHATLSDDPVANAADLLAQLESLAPKHPPHIDVVAYSRGGLVFRSLVEHLLPKSSFPCSIGRAVFVACTNAGTRLAEPENWHTLVDLYTNLAAGVFRLLSLLPQAQAAGLVLKELVQGVGALVKYLATHATGDVPGLAAMRPGGDFIRTLNETQQNQPGPGQLNYYAVTSEFEPVLTGPEAIPKELPRRLLAAIADGLIDRLMNEPNDLVVNTASMTAIDTQAGGFIQDTLAFGRTPQVYHTSYFTRPEVVNALARWLQLAWAAADGGPRRKLRAARGAEPVAAAPPLPAPAVTSLQAPAMVDTDIIVSPATASPAEVAEIIAEKSPSYVVVTRHYEGEKLHYAFRAEEVLDRTEGAASGTLLEALDLHETDQSERQPISAVGAVDRPSHMRAHARRGVVLVDEVPVGVVPQRSEAVEEDIVSLARVAAQPGTAAERSTARRAMPTLASLPEAASGPAVTCHFLADMDQQVLVNHTATIEVSISREQIASLAGRASAVAAGPVDPGRKLIVQVVPKANFAIEGADRVEVDPPAPDAPQVLYFDVKATHTGDGEIWVVARQSQMPIARLVLRPRIVDRKQLAAARISADARTAEAPPLETPIDQLLIVEQKNGSEITYFYELEFPSANVFCTYVSKPFTGNREEYVRNLYREIEKRWLSNQSDAEAFTEELRAFGASLFEELFPAEMQQALWAQRTTLRSIRVVSTEPFVPWELVHLREPGKALGTEQRFLGQMGLVRWMHNVDGLPPARLLVRPGKARYVIPEYPHPDFKLPEAEQEREFLEKGFGAARVEPQPNPVRKLIAEPGSFDLLHFACHGEAEGGDIANAHLVLEGRVEGGNYIPCFLSLTTVEGHANLRAPDGNRPLVVLNACQVGRAGYKLTGTGGFAQAFLRAGAGAFVGTLWSVGDAPARTFTETFYEGLRSGSRVSAAAIEAREKARAAGDATWLAYVVYGHPHATLTTT